MSENALGQWLDLIGPVIEARAYIDGGLVATGVKCNLPAVTNMSSEFRAMGTMNLSIVCAIEAMEFTITKVGTDMGLRKLNKQGFIDLEIRFAQDCKTINGDSRLIGAKAFLRCCPKQVLPSINIEPGTVIETECAYDVTRYQLFADGEEVMLIDRLAHIIRVDGHDYTEELRALI